MSEQNDLAKFKEIKQQIEKANLTGAKLNADIENAKANLDKLLNLAKQKFGTDNLDELEKKLIAQKEENSRIIETLKTNVTLAEQEIAEKTKLIDSIKNQS